MAQVALTAQARADLIDIWQTIAIDNPAAADRLVDRIEAASRRLALFPGLGVAREQVRPHLKLFPVRPYVVLYRAIEDGIQVVRVIHGARDWQRQL